MHLSDLQAKKIGILGFGIEGQAVAGYFARHALVFSVMDRDEKRKQDFEKFSKPAESGKSAAGDFFSGKDYLQHAPDFEILFRSPGIKLSEPQLQAAAAKGAVITSQIRFFMENCAAKIIGITGSKGKGTTAKLLFEILRHAGINAHLAGNYGVEALALLPKIKPEDYVILELSSFQLQDLALSPHIAVVLMVVPEHLDYHAGFQEYIEAKSSITRFQIRGDLAVINFDSPAAMQIGERGEGRKAYIQTLPEERVDRSDPFTIYQPEKYLRIKNGVFAEQLHGNIYFVEEGELHLLMPIVEVPLRGFHNMENVSAAAAVARALAVKDQIITDTIKNFQGLPHRLEFVAEKKGIKFYNDSIGTTPQSALAAIKSFHEPVLAIVGGAQKLDDYSEFAADLAKQKNLRAVALIGEIAGQLHANLEKNAFAGKIFTAAAGMQQALTQLAAFAEKGNAIILAPGTSSFGMFKNYQDRGEQFRAAVEKY